MSDYDARPQPSETARTDQGGWISGPSVNAKSVPAEDIEEGDRLLLDDGTVAEVTDMGYGYHWFPGGRQPGIAIGSQAGTSSGPLFRKASGLVQRVPS